MGNPPTTSSDARDVRSLLTLADDRCTSTGGSGTFGGCGCGGTEHA
jgi:hypothetical protein